MIIITTSRHPNPRLRSFAKDLANALPNAMKINRGKLSISELAQRAYNLGADRVILVNRGARGNPGRILFLRVFEDKFQLLPLILKVKGVKLLREIPESAPLASVKSACIIVPEGETSDLQHLGESLSDALNLHYLESDTLGILRRYFDILILVERASDGYVVKFIGSKKLLPAGPRIKIERVIYKSPIIKSEVT